jgi:hypothetical protein
MKIINIDSAGNVIKDISAVTLPKSHPVYDVIAEIYKNHFSDSGRSDHKQKNQK